MNETPVLSILCITYNQERYIAQAIESFVRQVVSFPFEIVIGDDHSTDSTLNICKSYQIKFSEKIRLLENKQNMGPQLNWIRTHNECRGKYIALCEGDDFWIDASKLQKQIDFLEENPRYSMCFTDSIVIDEKGGILKESRVPEDKKHNLSQSDILSGYCPPGNTAVFRSNLSKHFVEYTKDIINGDYCLFSLLTKHGDAAYLDFRSAVYRVHSGGIWATKDEDYRLINYIKVNRKLEYLIEDPNRTIIKNSIQSSYERLAQLNLEESFSDKSQFTPQTIMLRAIRDSVLCINGNPVSALSVDSNPSLEKILLRKWPEMEVTSACYPEFDAQRLHQFKDESFDIVFSHQVLEHIPKPWIAAKEMNRVLKSGGIGIHTSCAYNPRHGLPVFNDYYRFLPDGLAELFDGVNFWVKDGWGNKQVIVHNLTVDDGYGALGGRRFEEKLASQNDPEHPWHTWVIFQKR